MHHGLFGSLAFFLVFATSATARVEVGDAPPPLDFEAVFNAQADIDLSWDALADRTVVVEFWGTWCGPCVAVIPHMNELAEALEDEGVAFLSVTFEEPALIERFLEVRSMRSWVGCDMDRSVVDAYEPRGWPTAFVVHRGRVAWIGHPATLTAEVIREAQSGAVFAEGRGDGMPTVEAKADEGPARRDGFRSGEDPYSSLTEAPRFQLIVRESALPEVSQSMTSGYQGTWLGATPKSLAAAIWRVPAYGVSGDAWSETERFDLIYKLPDGADASVWRPMLQRAVLEALGMEVRSGRAEVSGFELRVADGGDRLRPGMSGGGGWSVTSDGQKTTLTGTSMPLSPVGSMISNRLGVPVRDMTDLERDYFIEFELPFAADAEAASAALEEQLGLTLVPVPIEIETLEVRRVGGE
ncbi:MAG: TIGR03435 family protein [Planctomycetota bacterium]